MLEREVVINGVPFLRQGKCVRDQSLRCSFQMSSLPPWRSGCFEHRSGSVKYEAMMMQKDRVRGVVRVRSRGQQGAEESFVSGLKKIVEKRLCAIAGVART